jgi:hypothetical protein
MKKQWTCWMVIAVCLGGSASFAAEHPALHERNFQDKLRSLAAEQDGSHKLHQAKDLAGMHWLSSLQVKAIASRLNDDGARLEFATTAYPRTVDPENFYEVYDAFSSFSKVMRLHDRIRSLQVAPPVAIEPPPATVTEEEMKDILRAVRKESFDNTRQQTARQILASSQKGFFSSQIKRLVDCFDFEPSKLDIAKYAYDYTVDREKYFVVNDAFSFDSSKATLSRYLASKNEKEPPRR